MRETREIQVKSAVLCVDLDGTLLRTDSLYECLLKAIRNRPRILLQLPVWLLQGRPHLKRAITAAASRQFDFEACPRQPEVERLISEARAAGKRVELVSAADHALIANHPMFRAMFDDIVGSSGDVNLKAEVKAEFLRKRHPHGFAYVGNSAADLPAWRAATERFAVNLPSSVRRRAEKEGIDLVELASAGPLLPPMLESMRLHQWLKNLLVFVPLALMSPRAGMSDLLTYLSGFFLFGLLTSGTYLLNDVMDIDADRQHPRKQRRPIASGSLPLPVAAMAAAGLILTAVIGSFLLSTPFAITVLAYLVLTLGYSFSLKRIPLVDVLVIAGLFTLRIVAGMALVGQPPSEWLLMFSIFFFFSLALMKREVELSVMGEAGAKILQGRGYTVGDRNFVMSFGIASGVASLVVFALFISSMAHQASQYVSPIFLWGAVAALSYWMMRMWLLTVRGVMNDDPILYAARDHVSLILAGLIVALMLSAQLVRL